MRKLRIAIAIPTYNRVEKLKFAFSKIEEQIIDEDVEIICVICSTASTDGTNDYLSKLKSNKVSLVVHSSLENSIFINWAKCFETVPKDVDWVWLHGDDDFLFENQSVNKICQLIKAKSKEFNDLSFIHACQARRSQNSQQVFNGSLFDLCNTFGYHELLGWMSSLIIRSDVFFNSFVPGYKFTYAITSPSNLLDEKVSAYHQSALLFNACFNRTALFVDIPLVEPQDAEQTVESMQRWQVTHEGERYFFVVDDFLKMRDEGILKKGVKAVFFRYLTYSLFDRYTSFLIGKVINDGALSVRDKEHLGRMRNLTTLFSEPAEAKLYLQWFQEFETALLDYEFEISNMVNKRNKLLKTHELSERTIYPFKVLL
jgi:glycosyltransferase involved in cell wall biosynthesis